VLAWGLNLSEGDDVLLIRDHFPATVLPWLPLRERGVEVRFLPHRAGLTPAMIADPPGPRTRGVWGS
jgi:cysteine desulfurase / selenocysteine lyase